MKIGNQIKEYRKENEYSQEDLAKKIYVSRQSISNWESGREYPDIHSIVLLSELLEQPVNQVLGDDLEEMRRAVGSGDQEDANKMNLPLVVGILAAMALLVPLVHYLKIAGVIIWGVAVAFLLLSGNKGDKQKSEAQLRTYREIIAFMDGTPLDEISKTREDSDHIYQGILIALLMGLAIGVVAVVLLLATR